MRIKKNDFIELIKPEFKCDNFLNPKIIKYDSLNHLNKYSTNIIKGNSGQGKSSLLYSFLMSKPAIYKKIFDNIIVVMPKNSRNSMENNIFEKYLKEENIYDSLNYDNIDEIYDKIKMNSDQNENTLLILDDVASALKNNYITQKLSDLSFNYRHYKLVMMILVQNFISVPSSIRRNMTNIILFKPKYGEFETIINETIELGDHKKIKELYKIGFDENHDWILINPSSSKIYKKFDEIILD